MPKKTNWATVLLWLLISLPVIAALSGFSRPVGLVFLAATTVISAIFGVSFLVGMKRVESWDRRRIPTAVERGFALP